jgi:hypothetical protein
MQGKCLYFGETRAFKDLDSLSHYVYLQTWTSGPGRQYWIIEHNGSQQRPIGGQAVQTYLRLVRERELKHRQPGLPLNPTQECRLEMRRISTSHQSESPYPYPEFPLWKCGALPSRPVPTM